MEQRRPAQPVPGGGAELELVGQHVGEDPDPLGVAPGRPVVGGQGRDQGDDRLGGAGGGVIGPVLAHPGGLGLEVADPAAGDGEARRGPVGEEQREPEQRRQRDQPLRQPLEEGEGRHLDGEEAEPPQGGAAEVRRAAVDPADEIGERQRGDDRQHEDGDSQQRAEDRAGAPTQLRGALGRQGIRTHGPQCGEDASFGSARPRCRWTRSYVPEGRPQPSLPPSYRGRGDQARRPDLRTPSRAPASSSPSVSGSGSGRSPSSSTTNAGTARATPTGCAVARSPSAPGSSPSSTPSRR